MDEVLLARRRLQEQLAELQTDSEERALEMALELSLRQSEQSGAVTPSEVSADGERRHARVPTLTVKGDTVVRAGDDGGEGGNAPGKFV